ENYNFSSARAFSLVWNRNSLVRLGNLERCGWVLIITQVISGIRRCESMFFEASLRKTLDVNVLDPRPNKSLR
ncbi:unnamed protein product, partial [Larinioides sclopetarius]